MSDNNELMCHLRAISYGIVTGAIVISSLRSTGKKLDAIKIVIDDCSIEGVEAAKVYFLMGIAQQNIIVASRYDELELLVGSSDILLNTHPLTILHTDLIQSMAEKPVIMIIHNKTVDMDFIRMRHANKDVIIYSLNGNNPNKILISMVYPHLVRHSLLHNKAIDDDYKLGMLKNLVSSMNNFPYVIV